MIHGIENAIEPDEPPDSRLSSEPRGQLRLDAADKQIIALLQDNGRATYTELAGKVGLSEASVRKRVQDLRREQVIQIVAVTDPLQLGFSHEGMLAVHSVADPEGLADLLSDIEEVNFVVLVAGRYSILLEAVATDDNAFVNVIQRIRQLAHPARVDVLPYLMTRKQDYAWGVR